MPFNMLFQGKNTKKVFSIAIESVFVIEQVQKRSKAGGRLKMEENKFQFN